MSYLEIKNLKKRYTRNGPLIVDDMNLSIEKGEFIVFLGPSGCGKTTTIRMIAGLEEVTGGDILIGGESVIDKLPRDRGVSMIFQSYAIWPHMTVYNNIAYPLKLQKLPKKEIDERVRKAARATEIEGLLNRYPSQMSGGQRQRVAVSRAIVVNSRILLMDEPLSNLDAKLRVAMRTELKRIHLEQHSTSIFVTHDQSEAMSIADRIVIMYKGKIEQIGTPDEVYQDSATRFVAEFIGTPPANILDAELCEDEDRALFAEGDGFRYRVPERMRPALENYIGKQVDFGIRPEFMEVSPDLHREAGHLCDLHIDFVEPQGSHAILISRIGNKEVKAQTVGEMTVRPGTEASCNIRDDKVMFFDKDTGRRIRIPKEKKAE